MPNSKKQQIKQSFLSTFSEQYAALMPIVNSPMFAEKLADMFKLLIPTNNVMIISNPSKNLPILEYNDLPPENRASIANQYVNGTFLLDPFYLAARKQGKNGFFHLIDIAPDGFEDSEYYKTYFKHSGLSDECGYIIQLADHGEKFIIISLGQIAVSETFTDKHLKCMKDISPLIESLAKQHWLSGEHENETQFDVRQQLETALECFGKSMLTEREIQMVQMILHGYSSKAIAERFNISLETVKLHRKNAYAKLDLSSQGELFNLFINSLINNEHYEGGDPLISYFGLSVVV
ncbi:LuxR C-terminal-related transcriptional regulator [Thalassotalea nanhaiensis]|uniref:LuxR C-terminal-related transcriptional regulator n=1 Tax=Thalassotalea nanhaiensis TaxID=3065648 RepID=A0ABY9TM69_9GAMM|nr:LuxR C-terminal-related transcriptional regulator [Colwelliaceae bacterium SQ345]